jgi:hypothetical protein
MKQKRAVILELFWYRDYIGDINAELSLLSGNCGPTKPEDKKMVGLNTVEFCGNSFSCSPSWNVSERKHSC